MDFKVSQKEERMQPGVGLVDVYVPDVFDLYITEEDGTIINAKILEGVEELQQAALFASVKQKGSDPLNSEDGVQWAELMLGEISTGAIIVQVKSAVRDVSVNCDVAFTAESDESGNTFLSYQLQVVA